MKKLYELQKGSKLYIDNDVVIFGHVDGLYSYCWLENDKNAIVHIKCITVWEEYKDGYRLVGDE